MHQLPRPSPRSATPANNPTTNPEQTNNSRDRPPIRSRSSVDLTSYTERAGGEASIAARNESASSGSQDRENSKLNQIIQHFHTKAALMICSSRAALPQVKTKTGDIRQNKWFNLVLDETDVLFDDLHEWRRPNLSEDRPLPLIVEIFLDTDQLIQNQALVFVDDSEKLWDVSDALASSADSSPRRTKNGARYCEVVLERWTIELGDPSGQSPAELNDALANVYKKGVVVFRSLYTFLRLLPAWKLYKKFGRQMGNQSLKLKFRIRQGHVLALGQKDSLQTPLCPSEHNDDDFVEHYDFPPLGVRVGLLRISLQYRKRASFGCASTEELISDHFVHERFVHGLDEATPPLQTGRSLPGNRSKQPRDQYSSTAAPATTTIRERPRGLLGAYGSLGTFHAPDKRGSPVSELKQRALEDDDEEDMMRRADQIKEGVEVPRRKPMDFIANPPFKGGSLASSPRPQPSPPTTAAERQRHTPSRFADWEANKRMSLNTLPQQQLRSPSTPNELALALPGSISPKPAPVRYSSSFAGRTRRFTSQSNRTADSNISSGRASSDSKEKSEQLNEAGTGSTGSAKTDEDDIASFISDLERVKDIKFHTPPTQRDNVINLTKYTNLREPNTQLADEMSASSLIQTSSTPPSRRLSNVPGLSTSSSPSRVAIHAPHVRSRLSTQSIVEEVGGTSAVSGEGSGSPKIPEDEEEDEPFIFPHDNLEETD